MHSRSTITAFTLAVLPATLPTLAEAQPAAPQSTSIRLDDATISKLRDLAFQAAREGDVTTLRAYFESGLPADIRNTRGDTLLVLAAYYGHTEAVAEILKQPSLDTNAVNAMGFTALTAAAFKGDLPTTRLLLERGADPNGGPNAARTPLMFAALFGRTEAARLLLTHGADPTRTDAAGATALTLAESQANTTMSALLKQAISNRPSAIRSSRPPLEAPKPRERSRP